MSKLVSPNFIWEQLDKEESSRNENKFRNRRPHFEVHQKGEGLIILDLVLITRKLNKREKHHIFL